MVFDIAVFPRSLINKHGAYIYSGLWSTHLLGPKFFLLKAGMIGLFLWRPGESLNVQGPSEPGLGGLLGVLLALRHPKILTYQLTLSQTIGHFLSISHHQPSPPMIFWLSWVADSKMIFLVGTNERRTNLLVRISFKAEKIHFKSEKGHFPIFFIKAKVWLSNESLEKG